MEVLTTVYVLDRALSRAVHVIVLLLKELQDLDHVRGDCRKGRQYGENGVLIGAPHGVGVLDSLSQADAEVYEARPEDPEALAVLVEPGLQSGAISGAHGEELMRLIE